MRAPPESLSPTTGAPAFMAIVHDLADLLGHRVAQAAAEHREVLREREHRAAVHGAVAGDDAVAGHAGLFHSEVVAAVDAELVHLDERAGIEQRFDALARHQEAALVALGRFVLAPSDLGESVAAVELLENVGSCHQVASGPSGPACEYREETEKTRTYGGLKTSAGFTSRPV